MRTTKGNENVFIDCGFPPAEAENLRIRAKMMQDRAIHDRHIGQHGDCRRVESGCRHHGWQAESEEQTGCLIGNHTPKSQRRNTLVNMVTAAGLKVDVDIMADRPRARR